MGDKIDSKKMTNTELNGFYEWLNRGDSLRAVFNKLFYFWRSIDKMISPPGPNGTSLSISL